MASPSPPSSSWNHQPWFLGAPVTKLATIVSLVTYVVVVSRGSGGGGSSVAWKLNAAHHLPHDYHHLLTYPLTFGTPGELVLGNLVLQSLSRRFEREMGSRKYCAFVVIVWFLSTALLMMLGNIVVTFGNSSFSRKNILILCGNYPLLGALLWLYHRRTPRLYPHFVGMLGMHVSEKALYYLLALQVVWFPRNNHYNLVPTLCGVLVAATVGVAWADKFHLLKVPWVARFSATWLEEPPRLLAPSRAATGALQHHHHRGGGGGIARPMAPPPAAAFVAPPPPQEAIEQLTNMGFEREAVIRALRQSQNQVERAADRLLSGN